VATARPQRVKPSTKRHVAKKKVVAVAPKPGPKKQKPASAARLAATPVAAVTTSEGSSAPRLFMLVGLLLALVAVGISLVPSWSVPPSIGIRLDRSRQAIGLTGLMIGAGCAIVVLLNVLSGG
jgi:hypothetical protein